MKIAEDALPETQSELRWRPGCHTGVVGLQRMMRPVSEACLSWIFLYCLAGQAAIKSPLSAVRLKCKEVDAAAHFAALSRGANALPPPQPGVSAGVPACHGSCCGVKRASLPFISRDLRTYMRKRMRSQPTVLAHLGRGGVHQYLGWSPAHRSDLRRAMVPKHGHCPTHPVH